MMISLIKVYSLSIVWFIFTTLFLFMAWKEFKRSKKDSGTLKNITPSSWGKVEILGINFAEMLNKFKGEINQSSKESHRIAATSYFLAGLTALASFIISLL